MIIITRNRKTVWKHGPNWPFKTLMLRTKLHQNPFFFTVHQNVNKTKNRAVTTVYGDILLPFYVIISFYSFFGQEANKTNCALVGCNLHCINQRCIKHRAENQITQITRFSSNILLGTTSTTTWGQTSKYSRASQLVGACIT